MQEDPLKMGVCRIHTWSGMCVIAFAGTILLTFTLRVAAQDADDQGEAVVEKYLIDGSSEKTFEQLRAQEEEKKRLADERVALDAEIRTTMKRIRSLLFEFELFLAGLQDGIAMPDCSQIKVLEQGIAEASGQLEIYVDKCRAIPEGAVASQKVCGMQVGELRTQLEALSVARQKLIEQCAAEGFKP
jgi:hypothetical protein